MSKTFIVSIVIALGIAMLLIYFNQRKLIYFPHRIAVEPQQYDANRMQVVDLNTSDGLVLKAWYTKAQNLQPTIVFFHGNAGHLGYRMPFINTLLNRGYGVLLVEYRGYADNPGKPTELGLYDDGRAAINYLLKNNISLTCVIFYGESLGTGVATKLATEYQVGGVILQSPFTSITAMAKHHYPWILVEPWDKFSSDKQITKLKSPLLVVHGSNDKVVPLKYGKQLYDKALKPKYFFELQAKGHNDMWGHELNKAIDDFIENNLTLCHKKR